MHRGPFGGRSKATASTTCQKCLKKDIYECTVSAQERPYKSRPSRTQQLLNPKLKPKLTTEVPDDLLRKKGIADEILAKKEEERGRRSSRNGERSSRKRSRSASFDSVSTISTNRSLSRSQSPQRRNRSIALPTTNGESFKKRGRASSSESQSSRQSHDRNMRRRLSSFSPQERGRRPSSRSDRMEMSQDLDTMLKKGRRGLSRSRSRSRGRGRRGSHGRGGYRHRKRHIRHNSLSRSPSRSPDRMDMSEERQSHPRNAPDRRESPAPRSTRSSVQSRSRSPLSPYREDRRPSPIARRGRPRSPSPFRSRNGSSQRNHTFGGSDRQFEERQSARGIEPARIPARRERSLSPYSKRVAMTRQMQAGR